MGMSTETVGICQPVCADCPLPALSARRSWGYAVRADVAGEPGVRRAGQGVEADRVRVGGYRPGGAFNSDQAICP